MDPNEISKLVAELNLEKEADSNVVKVDFTAEQDGVWSQRHRYRSMVVGKIFASRVANRETLRLHVPRILNIRNDIDIEIVGDNLFVVIFSSERDRNHALQDGPWHFFDSFMAFKEPQGLEKPSDVQFTEFTTWIQCHNLPILCMNPNTIRRIGEAVGRVEEIDEGEGRNCIGQYARVRVTRDLNKPLQRCVKVKLDSTMESQTVILRYERLPEFCSACGRIGHPVRHCSDSLVKKDTKAYGPWLRVTKTQDLRRSRRPDVRGNRHEGKQFGGTRDDASATWGSSHREEETGANDEVEMFPPANRPAASIEASDAQVTTQRNMGKEEGQRNSCDKSLLMSGDLEEGGCSTRVNHEKILLEAEVTRRVPQSDNSKMTMRGWKRQARNSDNRQDVSSKPFCADITHLSTRKRGGETREDEDFSSRTKQPRLTYPEQGTEVTAETARQSRRSP